MTRVLLKGNEAIAEGAIAAGCRFYAGYPITPQNELTAAMARRMPALHGTFIQAESEIAAVNLCFGASVAGARAMTSTSSPGFSLMQEAISYLAGCEVPCVLVNVMRGGPGLGNIQPSQADYFQAVKGGGHGDYHNLVLAPATVEEAYRYTLESFELAEKYRNPVVILADGLLGQLMEPVEPICAPSVKVPVRDWTLDGAKGRPPRFVRSLLMADGVLEKHNYDLERKYALMRKEARWSLDPQAGSRLLIVAYGSSARAAMSALRAARSKGMKVELLRLQTLYPFPTEAVREAAERAGRVLTVEMSLGQMVEDVRLAVEGKAPVEFLGRPGGAVVSPAEILAAIERILDGPARDSRRVLPKRGGAKLVSSKKGLKNKGGRK